MNVLNARKKGRYTRTETHMFLFLIPVYYASLIKYVHETVYVSELPSMYYVLHSLSLSSFNVLSSVAFSHKTVYVRWQGCCSMYEYRQNATTSLLTLWYAST